MADEPQRTDPIITNSIGKGDQKSRAKAATAAERTAKQDEYKVDADSWPRGVAGQPMMRITMMASELIPTGQYANISIGPAQITAYVDPDRTLKNGETYFSGEQRAVMAQALNELAEIVEADVIAVQRSMVLETMQQQIGR